MCFLSVDKRQTANGYMADIFGGKALNAADETDAGGLGEVGWGRELRVGVEMGSDSNRHQLETELFLPSGDANTQEPIKETRTGNTEPRWTAEHHFFRPRDTCTLYSYTSIISIVSKHYIPYYPTMNREPPLSTS